uniref:Beta/gamma crystallin 'Greek key' domain-containing protein n=1 Tax=Xenopus tropicalis TaxID=8364 RepID=A0A1B8XT54_XENTR
MNRIELFQLQNLQGSSVALTADSPDLSAVGFWRKAQSLRVCGDPWVVFTNQQYEGDFSFYEEGTYNSIPGFAGFIGSVRVVPGGFSCPSIILYEHINYEGRSVPVKKSVDSVVPIGFNDMASSHRVESGAWILYEHVNYRGHRMVTVAGDNVSNYVPLGGTTY